MFFGQLIMGMKTRLGSRFGLQPSEPSSTDLVEDMNAESSLMEDEAYNSTYGNPPVSKKPRIESKCHFTMLKLHTRLVAYDCVGTLIHLPALSCTSNYSRYLYLKDRNDPRSCYGRMSVVACVCGDLEALQYLHEIPDNPFVPRRYERLLDEECNMESICYILACNGHWKALKWAITKQYPCKKYVLRGAVMGGADVVMLEWLSSMGCKIHAKTYVDAIKRSDTNVMTWLWIMNNYQMTEKTFKDAVIHGDLKILKWLKEEDCPWDKNVFQAAAERGDIKILLWLRMEECPWDSDTFNQAIKSGADLVTLQWFLREDDLLTDYHTFEYAVRRGDVEVLQWLRSQGCEMCDEDFTTAVEEGVAFDILKWMQEVGFPWDEDTFEAAVGRGDLDILKWMREKRCPWDERCINLALKQEMIDIVRWLNKEGCPHDGETHYFLMNKLFPSILQIRLPLLQVPSNYIVLYQRAFSIFKTSDRPVSALCGLRVHGACDADIEKRSCRT